MKWKLDLDDCKQACIDDENCKGLTFLPLGEEDNCFGKTDVCAGNEYEFRDGAQAYVLVRGIIESYIIAVSLSYSIKMFLF